MVMVSQPIRSWGFDPRAGVICPRCDNIGIATFVVRSFAARLIHELPCEDLAPVPVTVDKCLDVVSVSCLARLIGPPSGAVAAERFIVGRNSAQIRPIVGEDDDHFEAPFLGHVQHDVEAFET